MLAVALAAVTWWLTDDQDSDSSGPIEGLDTRLDYALEDFEMRAFDEAGKPALKLWAPRLTNDALTRIGRVERPRVEVVHEGFLWHLEADSAIISDDQEEVLLGGRVTLTREGALPSDGLRIDSEEVTLIIEQRLARSERPVQVADMAGRINAVGFMVDMLKNEFQMHNDVQGNYVTPP